jgi:hypothetical protein
MEDFYAPMGPPMWDSGNLRANSQPSKGTVEEYIGILSVLALLQICFICSLWRTRGQINRVR